MNPTRRQFLKASAAAAATAAGLYGYHHVRRPGSPNVVVFTIDTLRADRMSLHGYGRETTPFLDALARESVVFDDAAAPGPWTVPSVASLFTGRYPCEHRLGGDRTTLRAPDRAFLARQMQRQGYRTLQWSRNVLATRFGLSDGFDHVHRGHEARIAAAYPYFQDAAPLYAYVHIVDPHDPYEPDNPARRKFSDADIHESARLNKLIQRNRILSRADVALGYPGPLGALGPAERKRRDEQIALAAELAESRDTISDLYDGEVRQADTVVRDFVGWLQDQGRWDNTLFILLSDHGEELYDRGYWQHDQSLYNELTHVPLLVRFPGGDNGGRRIADPVSLIDVPPTILDVIGAGPPPPEWRGQSLLKECRTGVPPVSRPEGGNPGREATPLVDAPIRCTAQRLNVTKRNLAYEAERGHINLGFRDGPWKAIWNVQPNTWELYHLDDDPTESKNQATAHPDRLAEFQAHAHAEFQEDWESLLEVDNPQPQEEIDPHVQESIDALGYL